MRTQVRSLLLGNILFWGITMSVNTEPASAWFGGISFQVVILTIDPQG